MQKDRSNWTVRKVALEDGDELDNNYYASLTAVERLEILMDLRSLIDPGTEKIAKVVFKRKLDEKKV